MSDVLARVDGTAGRLTLNRPETLNALTLAMIRRIDAALTAWEHDAAVALVVVDGAGGRAFCAGGDIRTLYGAVQAQAWDEVAGFFRAEYALDARIARYPKPVVTIMDGVTMGGGIGVGAHASHRVVTERSRLALPETRIGFVPDVGSSYLLSRAPGQLGTFMALTGSSADGADAVDAGLADALVPAGRIEALQRRLSDCADAAEVAAAVRAAAEPRGRSRLAAERPWIDACFAGDDVDAILRALRASSEPGAGRAAAAIEGNAPTAVTVTLEALRRARGLATLEACLDQEFRISMRATREPDFAEGVRAAIIDKDRKPAWMPPHLAAVDPEAVRRHFVSDGMADLGLSDRQAGRTG